MLSLALMLGVNMANALTFDFSFSDDPSDTGISGIYGRTRLGLRCAHAEISDVDAVPNTNSARDGVGNLCRDFRRRGPVFYATQQTNRITHDSVVETEPSSAAHRFTKCDLDIV
jgi:hypothetical protein